MFSSAKPLNTMSGALILWREGKTRPIHAFVALAVPKAMIGASSQAFSSGRCSAMRATSALNSVTYIELSAAKGLSTIARSKSTSSWM